jgi:excisionase family DNA binding protein
MASPLLTTGKAARICSVKPDTVLKWIKKGVLPASRTAGGHYRVEEHDLSLVLSQDDASESSTQDAALCNRPMRCWEYMNNGPGTECHECVVYKVRASYCFRMVAVMKAAGHAKRFCSGLCQECPYYRRVQGLPTNVLVISRDEKLIQDLAKRESEHVTFRFARRGYDASAIITVFRPAFVIFDEAILERLGLALLDAIAADPRTMGTRILVGIRKGSMAMRIRHTAVYGTIQTPFDADEVLAVINRIPIEPLEAEAGAKV